jgi:anti-sigma factor RsiW
MSSVRHWREHRWARVRMSAYVDGELTDAQRLRFEAHAERCKDCGPMRRSLMRVVWGLRTLGPVASAEIAPEVIRRLRDQERCAPVED